MFRVHSHLLAIAIVLAISPLPAQEDASIASSVEQANAASEWFSGYDPSWDVGWDRSWSQSTAPWTLSVSGGLTATDQANELGPSGTSLQLGSGGRNYYAMATLQIPLESPALRRRPSSTDGAARRANREPKTTETAIEQTAQSGEIRSHQATLLPEQMDSRREKKRDVLSDSSIAAAALEQASARRKRAQSELIVLFKQLVTRATEADGHKSALGDLARLAHRSRVSGLVPELRLRGVYGFDRTVSQQDSVGIYPGDLTTRGGQDSLLEARLTFRLDRLVYGDQESSLFQKRRDLQIEAKKRAQLATSTLVEWMTAVRQSQDDSLLPDEWLKAEAKRQHALLSLHLLTDGWFQGRATLEEQNMINLLNELNFPRDSAELQLGHGRSNIVEEETSYAE